MKVYFSASVSLDRSKLPLYQNIVEQVKDLGHEVLSEEIVINPDFEAPRGEAQAKEAFKQATKEIEDADAVVAEVSLPSWGTAFLMEHALESGKPVLALFYRDAKHELPTMIQGHPDLYVENYNRANIHAILKKNLKHFELRMKRKGKLLVIDGADGAGKATQTELLTEYLHQNRVKTKHISFPRYGTSFHGRHLTKILKGEFGQLSNPYLASLAFALDRLTAKDEILEWLEQGSVVIADRYVSANMAHQASKLDKDEKEKFLSWVYDMEYKEHKLPKEDIVIFLDVPTEISQKLLAKFAEETGFKKDVAEEDIEHQKRSLQEYRALVKKYNHWHRIECVKDGELLSKQEIHHKILDLLRKKKIID